MPMSGDLRAVYGGGWFGMHTLPSLRNKGFVPPRKSKPILFRFSHYRLERLKLVLEQGECLEHFTVILFDPF